MDRLEKRTLNDGKSNYIVDMISLKVTMCCGIVPLLRVQKVDRGEALDEGVQWC